MSPRPLITVIIPAYNLATYLPEAIESALGQSLARERLDVLVIDDGSTDDTPSVIRRYLPRVRYVRQDNRGLPAARNRGIAESDAPYLTFLDADDRLLPDKLEHEVERLEHDASVAVAYSGWHYIDAAGRRLPQQGWSRVEGDVLPRLLLGNIVHPHAPSVRRSAIVAAGGFDESLTSVEDWDLWIRISLAGARWAATNRPALEYRVRDDGMHANPGRMLSNRLRVLDKTFARIAAERPPLLVHRESAYQRAYLEAACDWARCSDFAAATAAIRDAVAAVPGFLHDPRGLRELCRLLVPLGHRNDAVIADRWPLLAPAARALVRAGASGRGVAYRLRCEAAFLRVAARYRRKRARAVLQEARP